MASIVQMTPAQLSEQFLRSKIELPETGVVADFIASPSPEKSEKPPAVKWPETIDVLSVLGSLTGEPLQSAVSFTVDFPEQHLVFRAKDADKYILFSTSAANASIIHDISNSELVATFAQMLEPAETAPPSLFSAEMSLQATIALGAILDRLRLLVASSLIERAGLQSIDVLLDDLIEQVEEGMATPDYRWFCAILSKLFAEKAFRKTTEIKKGCEELEKLGLLVTLSKSADLSLYRPSNALVNAALELLVPLPCLLFPKSNISTVQTSGGTAFFSGRSIWMMDVDGDKTNVKSVDGLDVFSAINELLTFKENKAAKHEFSQEQNKTDCSNCGTSNNSDDKFCKNCGTSLKNEPATCAKCKSELEPSKKFCTNCGTPVHTK